MTFFSLYLTHSHFMYNFLLRVFSLSLSLSLSLKMITNGYVQIPCHFCGFINELILRVCLVSILGA